MRYGCIALFLLISSVASAQEGRDLPTVRTIDVSTGFTTPESRVSLDQMVARMMTFDRNGDGKVATAELPERTHILVTRGDTSGDGALDDSEIRALTVQQLKSAGSARNLQSYGFGDTSGSLSTRNHIHNAIEDLKLAPQTSDEARRIADLFVDRLENTARVRLRTGMAGTLSEEQLAQFERDAFSQGTQSLGLFISARGGTAQMLTNGGQARLLLGRTVFTPEQLTAATAVIGTFNADLRLDDVRRSALVAELADVLTDEESNNFSAALARRPVVQTGIPGGVVGGFTRR